MAPSDPHTGGRLEDMAPTGTSIPNDAGLQNIIPSKARPDQDPSNPNFTTSGAGTNLATAADNATDIPRSTREPGMTGEVMTGAGDSLPAEIETKRMHIGPDNPVAKGHDRTYKHQSKDSGYARLSQEGAEMQPAPGEEEDDQNTIRARKGGLDDKSELRDLPTDPQAERGVLR